MTLSLNFKGQLTKLHVWSLVEYNQVIYYDSDFVFLHNPISVIAECNNATVPLHVAIPAASGAFDSQMVENGHTPFCAMNDIGIGAHYFNAGYMVITPNLTTYESLLAHRGWSDNSMFADQDMLNRYYQGAWKKLSERYNKMHVCTRPQQGCNIDNDTVAIHEKIYLLRTCCYQSTWIWNHMNSSYDIDHQVNGVINSINRTVKISRTVVDRRQPKGNYRPSLKLQSRTKPKIIPKRNPKINLK